MRALARTAVAITHKIETLGKVVIAAINGHAHAGGAEFAFATDIRVMSEEATLAVTGPDLDYRTPLPPSSEAALMQQELSILGPDDVYERVLNA